MIPYVDRSTGEVRAHSREDYDRIRVDFFRAGTPPSAMMVKNAAEKELRAEVAGFIQECALLILQADTRPGTTDREALDAMGKAMRALSYIL